MAKKIVVWIILIIVLAVTSFLIINNISKSNPQYVAHQGYSSKYPGNTALSFTKAAERSMAEVVLPTPPLKLDIAITLHLFFFIYTCPPGFCRIRDISQKFQC